MTLVNAAQALNNSRMKLVQRCSTRWNSDLHQMESVVDLLPAMHSLKNPNPTVSGGCKLADLLLTENEVESIQSVIRLLRGFSEFSEKCSS